MDVIQTNLGSSDDDTDPGRFPIKSSLHVSITLFMLISNHFKRSSNVRETPKSKTCASLIKSTSNRIRMYLGKCGFLMLFNPLINALKTLARNYLMLLNFGACKGSIL